MKSSGPQCPECGAALAPDAPQGLCPACLFAAGLSPATVASQPDAEATLDSSQSKPASGGSQLKFTTPSASSGLPQSIRYFGDYELDSEIARGGMGVVYRARQVSLNRVVALKMILAGQFVGETEVQRFRAEAEAAANLNHPNIVPIYEIGLHEGRHYFSMKLVEGGSLADKLRNAERGTRSAGDFQSPPVPSKPTDGDWKSPAPFPRTERVALLAQVARAVHHAHQRGVLHRDLKPGNILLDELGQPFVTDFGLAKRLEGGADLTHTGATMGTPAYMAPEQAAGRVKEFSTALDVYALGAILFHLLTGRVPFTADTPLATMKLVMEQEAPSPRTLDATIDRDLETICLKCLEKDPKRRYGSAESLAEELDHWLRHEPIAARPITNGERVVKWVRRKPAIATLSAATAVAVVLGVVGILWQWRVAVRARQQADESAQRAEANFKNARQVVEYFLTRVADHPKLKGTDLYALRKELLETAVPFCEDFVRQRGGDPAVVLARGQVYGLLGNVRSTLGETSRAIENWQQARDIFAGLVQTQPSVVTNYQALAESHEHLGRLHLGEGRVREAEQACLQALEIRQWVVNAHQSSADCWRDAAAVRHFLGIVWQKAGEPVKAEAAYRQGLELLGQFGARFPDYAAHRQVLAGTHLSLGSLLMNELGRLADAEKSFREAAPLFAALAGEHPNLPSHRFDQALTLGNLGLVLREANQLPEAERVSAQAAELLERLANDFPAVPVYRQHQANSQRTLGTILSGARGAVAAEPALRKAHDLHAKLADEFPATPDYRSALGEDCHGLATVCLDRQNYMEVRQLLSQAIKHQQSALALNPQNSAYQRNLQRHADSLAQLADTLLRQGDHALAAETALEFSTRFSEDGRAWHRAASFLARCMLVAKQDARLGATTRAAQAESYATRAVECLKQALRLGFKPTEPLRQAPAFESLREREDFRKLVGGTTSAQSLPPEPTFRSGNLQRGVA